MAILGDRINGDYLDKLCNDPDLLDDVENTIGQAIFYASDAVSITMSTDKWDAVLVLLREGKTALGVS
jgi:hypothetical protein